MMQIFQEIGIRIWLTMIPAAQPNLAAVGLSTTMDVPSFGHPSCSRKLHCLSTTEAKYIAMSMAQCDVLPIMNLVKEMKDHSFPVLCTEPYV